MVDLDWGGVCLSHRQVGGTNTSPDDAAGLLRHCRCGGLDVLSLADLAMEETIKLCQPLLKLHRKPPMLLRAGLVLAGHHRGYLRQARLADLARDPESGIVVSRRRRTALSAGFVLGGLRLRLHDVLGALWWPVDWVISSESRTGAAVATSTGAFVVYFMATGGLHELLTTGIQTCPAAAAILYGLTRRLRRIRGPELAHTAAAARPPGGRADSAPGRSDHRPEAGRRRGHDRSARGRSGAEQDGHGTQPVAVQEVTRPEQRTVCPRRTHRRASRRQFVRLHLGDRAAGPRTGRRSRVRLDLHRLLMVDEPGTHYADVVSTLAAVCPVVITAWHKRLPARAVDRLAAHLRRSGTRADAFSAGGIGRPIGSVRRSALPAPRWRAR